MPVQTDQLISADSDLNNAKKYLLANPSVKAVAIKDGRIIGEERGEGLRPLIALINHATARSKVGFRGASVADRVIGEAAAVLLIDAGAIGVFGEMMSTHAEERLMNAGITVARSERVDVILARDGRGKCFMEQQVEGITDVADAATRLRNVIG